MDIEKLIEAVRLCGSTPKVDQCKQCAYWAGGDMSRCIPNMTGDAATELSAFQAENEKLRNEVERQRRSADDRQHLYENAERAYIKAQTELEQVKREKESLLKYAADMGECCLCTYDSFCPTDNPMFGDCEECEKSRKCPCITCSETKNWKWRGKKED